MKIILDGPLDEGQLIVIYTVHSAGLQTHSESDPDFVRYKSETSSKNVKKKRKMKEIKNKHTKWLEGS